MQVNPNAQSESQPTSVLPDPPTGKRLPDAARVVYSLREGAIRLAPHCFNTVDEIEVALQALEG